MSKRVKKAAPAVRDLTADEVTFTLTCEPEDIAIEGNAMASGDDAADRRQEEWIYAQLDSGNEWAWCCARVCATWGEFMGDDYLGCCSYEGEDAFMVPGGYYDDMKAEALRCLNAAVQAAAKAIAPLLEDGPC